MAQGQAEEGVSGLLPKPPGQGEMLRAWPSVPVSSSFPRWSVCILLGLLTDSPLAGGNSQLLFKCHFSSWLPGAGLQNASCSPGAVSGSPQGRSRPSLRGRCHRFHSLAEKEGSAGSGESRGQAQVGHNGNDGFTRCPQSFQDAFPCSRRPFL